MFAEAAPAHAAHVRALVIDVLSPGQLYRLGRDADRIVSRIATSESAGENRCAARPLGTPARATDGVR
jgi:hypothetical protein